jgi:hypothetical protein
MFKRCLRRLDLHTVTTDSPSFRAMPLRAPMAAVINTPYRDAFKEYWATPIPWQPRDYGQKPKPGDPVPLREAATTLVVAKNKHIDRGLVDSGEDNDYKVLMQFREAKGRYQKDQFVLPGAPINLQDREDDWVKVLYRLGVKKEFKDIDHRICAMRALLAECNLLVVPPNGGNIAEVEGPPGPRKWHMMVASSPSHFRQLVDILEIPMEEALDNLKPFGRIQTPATEMFRFDTMCYVVAVDKMPCVKYTISTIGEQLVWVSPKEAMARFDAGVMDMPTPNLVFLEDLDRRYPTFDKVRAMEVMTSLDDVPVVLPELVHDPATNMATVLLPGDIHHSNRRAAREQRKQQNLPPQMERFSRFDFTKDIPWGVRSVFTNRPIGADEEVIELPGVAPLTIQEADTLKLEHKKENEKVMAEKLRRVANPEFQNLKKMLKLDEPEAAEIERVPTNKS